MQQEMQLLNSNFINQIKRLPQKAIKNIELKKCTDRTELKLHIKELENFINHLETKNLVSEKLVQVNNLEQACNTINSDPELKKLYKEYLEEAYSNAQKSYFIGK